MPGCKLMMAQVTMAATFLLNVYGNRFYSLLGAPLSSLAFYTALARSLDCLTDPVMGWWSGVVASFGGGRGGWYVILRSITAIVGD